MRSSSQCRQQRRTIIELKVWTRTVGHGRVMNGHDGGPGVQRIQQLYGRRHIHGAVNLHRSRRIQRHHPPCSKFGAHTTAERRSHLDGIIMVTRHGQHRGVDDR